MPTTPGSPLLLSNANPRPNKSKAVAKKYLYSDLDLSLFLSAKNDIDPLVDLEAVKNSVRNLLVTNHFDRPFQPYLGANLGRHLFEPADQFTFFAMNQDIKITLENYEPRIDQVKVLSTFNEDFNQYVISVAFRVITPNVRTDMTVRLSRLR